MTTLTKPQYFNPSTSKLFRPNFAPKGVCFTPGFWTSRPNFFVKLFMGMFSGSRNPMVIVFFLSRSRDLKIQGNFPCSWLWSHSMTFTFKVMEWLHGIYSYIFKLLDQKNRDIDSKITLLACFQPKIQKITKLSTGPFHFCAARGRGYMRNQMTQVLRCVGVM